MICDDYFLVEPDWASPFILTRQWRTSIQTTLKRGEKRASLVDRPAKSIEFNVTPKTAEESNYIRRKLYRASDKIFGIPLWCDATWTTTAIGPGTGDTFWVEDVETRNWLAHGPIALMTNSAIGYKYFEIKEYRTSHVTYVVVWDDPFTNTWPIGSLCVPLLQGRINRSVTIPEVTSYGHGSIHIEVTEEFDSDSTPYVYGSHFNTYLGYRVMNLEPERSSTPQSVFESYPEVMKFLGLGASHSYNTEGAIVTKNLYRGYGRTQLKYIYRLVDFNRGRWGEFWYPSWQDDIVLASGFLSIDDELNLAHDIDWEATWGHNRTIGRYIYVLCPDGTEIIRRIVSSTTTLLTLDAAMGKTVDSPAGVIVCFLYMGRLNQDYVSIHFHALDGPFDTELSFHTLNDVVTITTTTTTT